MKEELTIIYVWNNGKMDFKVNHILNFSLNYWIFQLFINLLRNMNIYLSFMWYGFGNYYVKRLLNLRPHQQQINVYGNEVEPYMLPIEWITTVAMNESCGFQQLALLDRSGRLDDGIRRNMTKC